MCGWRIETPLGKDYCDIVLEMREIRNQLVFCISGVSPECFGACTH